MNKAIGIAATDLSIGYGNKVVRSALSFSLMSGEMVCLLGPNGCGKSTLLRTLAGLQLPLGGTTSFASLTQQERAKRLALVLTERNSPDHTSVHDIVAMGRYPYTSFLGALSERDEQVISQSLDAVQMQGYAQRMFSSLSDGESQRILIAKALAQQTPVILLDEPTAFLDLPNRLHLMRLLQSLAHEQEKTILISTHELDLALHLADRILLLSPQGLRLDTPQRLLSDDALTLAFGMDVLHY